MNGVAATEPEPAESALMGQGGSIGEIIRKKQEELKQKLVEMARAESLASAPPVPVPAPPGMEGPETRRPARRCKPRQCKEAHEKETANIEIQTIISLPHTMREVLWTASSFEPVVDGSDNVETGAPPQSIGVTGIMDYLSDEAQPPKLHMSAETNVGNGVMDLDILEEEEEEIKEEIKIYGMKADELYAYVFTMIMIFGVSKMNAEFQIARFYRGGPGSQPDSQKTLHKNGFQKYTDRSEVFHQSARMPSRTAQDRSEVLHQSATMPSRTVARRGEQDCRRYTGPQ